MTSSLLVYAALIGRFSHRLCFSLRAFTTDYSLLLMEKVIFQFAGELAPTRSTESAVTGPPNRPNTAACDRSHNNLCPYNNLLIKTVYDSH